MTSKLLAGDINPYTFFWNYWNHDIICVWNEREKLMVMWFGMGEGIQLMHILSLRQFHLETMAMNFARTISLVLLVIFCEEFWILGKLNGSIIGCCLSLLRALIITSIIDLVLLIMKFWIFIFFLVRLTFIVALFWKLMSSVLDLAWFKVCLASSTPFFLDHVKLLITFLNGV